MASRSYRWYMHRLILEWNGFQKQAPFYTASLHNLAGRNMTSCPFNQSKLWYAASACISLEGHHHPPGHKLSGVAQTLPHPWCQYVWDGIFIFLPFGSGSSPWLNLAPGRRQQDPGHGLSLLELSVLQYKH